MSTNYYDRNGRPITEAKWSILTNNPDYRLVFATSVAGATVSTLWFGMELSRDDDGRPQIFETLVRGGSSDGRIERYATLYAASVGHANVVRLLDEETQP